MRRQAFAERGKNLVIIARRGNNLERLKWEILQKSPDLDIVIRSTDLSIPENVYQFYEGLKEYEIETWIRRREFERFITTLEKLSEEVTTFEGTMWSSLVEYITVNRKDDLRFMLACGMEMLPRHSGTTRRR